MVPCPEYGSTAVESLASATSPILLRTLSFRHSACHVASRLRADRLSLPCLGTAICAANNDCSFLSDHDDRIPCYSAILLMVSAFMIVRPRYRIAMPKVQISKLIEHPEYRPIFARAAADNIGSIRELQKCGLKSLKNKDFAHGRG